MPGHRHEEMQCLAAFLLTALAAAGATRAPPESAASCPYDLSTAARMIPPECFANATAGQAATGCCWYVLAAYIFAAADHANRTGEAFLPRAPAAACSGAFPAALVSGGLVSRSLLAGGTDGSCDLTGDRLKAGSRPCQLAGVEAVRAQAPRALPNATRLCAGSPAPRGPGCSACRGAVIAATYEMLATAHTKESVPCGMAATVAVWSRAPPPLERFRAYALCMLQVLENVNSLGTSNLVPSPPPPMDTEPPAPSKPAASSSSSRRNTNTIPIAAGSAVASVAAVFSIVFAAVVITTRMSRRRRLLNEGTDSEAGGGEFSDDDSSVATVPPPLPREGLYIFTKAELVQATNGYEKRLLLGTGGAGKVYLGTLPSGQRVAVKRMYRSKKVSEFYAEASVLATLRHRNLATLVGYCLGDRRHHALVYEYMAGGSLCRALSRGDLPWRRRLQVAADVAEGLAYLHALRVVHRDVKPANVLLSSDLAVAKLSDFGVARAMPVAGDGGTHLSTEVRGTRGYVDPETFAAGHVTEAADVYGFGVVLLELATGMRAVVPTPSGGAESVVHAAHRAVAEAGGGEEGAAAEAVVDRRLGPAWDRPTVRAVFVLACRCVRPYKHERPEINEVLAVLRAALADYDARANDDAEEGSEGTASSSAATLDPASLPSTPSSTVSTW